MVNRATCTDGLCIEMYKCTLDTVLPYLHVLFNRVFGTEQFPKQWGESIISPIHKIGSKLKPNNYRAISLINSLCTIVVLVLITRLTNWCEDNSVIEESQTEIRCRYSTIDNIFTLNGIIQQYLSKRKGRCNVFYIYFLKAFDGCIHKKLWYCLSRQSVQGKCLCIFDAMYR